MGILIASTVIAKASTMLQDVTNVRWPLAEMLDWLNAGQREILIYKPNAYTRNAAVQLAAGTKQTLPADGLSLIDVVRNMGTDGATPGRSIRLVMREILDSQNPDWHTSTPSATTVHYVYSPLDLRTFYVYPPQPASGRGYAEIIYSATPPAVGLSDAIAVDDIYEGVLVDYMMYRAYSKDTEYAANAAMADKHQAAYLGALTGKIKSEMASNPNANALGNPNAGTTRQ